MGWDGWLVCSKHAKPTFFYHHKKFTQILLSLYWAFRLHLSLIKYAGCNTITIYTCTQAGSHNINKSGDSGDRLYVSTQIANGDWDDHCWPSYREIPGQVRALPIAASHRTFQDKCNLTSAANRLIGEVVQSRRRPLLGPSPGWKRLLALSHLRHY